MIDIGNRIKEIRLAKSMSAKELAISLDVSPSFISAIEKGTKKVSIENLFKLCETMNISMSDFFKTETDLEPELKQWIGIGKDLTDDQRLSLISAINALKE